MSAYLPDDAVAAGLANRGASEQAEGEDTGPRPLFKFVLTGGPCGGKTTALARLQDFFRMSGFRVFTVPEAATTLWNNGVSLSDVLADPETQYRFQEAVLTFQLTLEDSIARIARSIKRPAVLLCDRGTLDGAAYMSKDMWQRLLRSKKTDMLEVREGRYDAIFHLVTAAEGAEAYYSALTNSTRLESPEEARELDLRTQAVWNGHPRHYVVDNSTDFEGKLERLQRHAAALVGLPHIPKGANRFLLKSPPDLSTFTESYETTEVRKVYLVTTEGQLPDGREVQTEYNYVEERSQQDGPISCVAYVSTIKRRLSDGHVSEVKRIISAREFASRVQSSADRKKRVVRQTRYSFLYKHQAFVVICQRPNGGGEPFFTLRRQAEDGEPDFPPFLDVGELIPDFLLEEDLFQQHKGSA